MAYEYSIHDFWYDENLCEYSLRLCPTIKYAERHISVAYICTYNGGSQQNEFPNKYIEKSIKY